MRPRAVTVIGLALGPVAIVLLDLLVTREAAGPFYDTLREGARSTAIPAFVFGVLMGHWYYPGTTRLLVPRPQNYYWLIGTLLVVLGASIPLAWWDAASNFMSFFFLLLGLPVGAKLWSMED